MSVLNSRAQQIYDETRGILEKNGMWEEEDHTLCELFAYNKERWEAITNQIGDSEFLVKGRRQGEKIKDPRYTLQKQFMDAYKEALDGLGLGVATRRKLKIERRREMAHDPTNPMNL